MLYLLHAFVLIIFVQSNEDECATENTPISNIPKIAPGRISKPKIVKPLQPQQSPKNYCNPETGKNCGSIVVIDGDTNVNISVKSIPMRLEESSAAVDRLSKSNQDISFNLLKIELAINNLEQSVKEINSSVDEINDRISDLEQQIKNAELSRHGVQKNAESNAKIAELAARILKIERLHIQKEPLSSKNYSMW